MIDSFTQNLSQYLQGASLLAFLVVYAAGILTSLTPCVYPVIPITIAFIGAQGSKSKIRTFLLSLVYVTGMALTYTGLGGAAALSGKLFGQFQTNAWVYFIIANLCILMGLSMLGVFSLRVRTPGIVSRLQPKKGDGRPRRQFSCRGGVRADHRPLHGACPGRTSRLCRRQAESGLWYGPSLRLCFRDGYFAHHPGDIRRNAGEHAPVGYLDDKDKPHIRLDHDRRR